MKRWRGTRETMRVALEHVRAWTQAGECSLEDALLIRDLREEIDAATGGYYKAYREAGEDFRRRRNNLVADGAAEPVLAQLHREDEAYATAQATGPGAVAAELVTDDAKIDLANRVLSSKKGWGAVEDEGLDAIAAIKAMVDGTEPVKPGAAA
jgi:hypothetical protein